MTTVVQEQFAVDRAARLCWSEVPLRKRLACVKRLRHILADRAGAMASAIDRDRAQTLTSEVLPLLEACRFLEDNAAEILAPRRPVGSRPMWLRGVDIEVRREPFGTVLVIGPSNYPLFLPAVHALQALVAGNGVIIKPGHGGGLAVSSFVHCLSLAGFPQDVVKCLGEDPADAQFAIEAGVDKVVLTGSSATGRAVLEQLARTGTPSVMELSGHDVVFVQPGADIELVRKAIGFGRRLNGGNTCIAPRQVIAWRGTVEGLELPVEFVETDDEALALAERSGYALGATVFGRTDDCVAFARRVRAGVVVVNDMIVPTADPRLPFGGRGRSGFGTTRGAEGLLEMTTIKAIAVRRSRWLPHLESSHPGDADLFNAYIGLIHGGGGWLGRLRSLTRLMREAKQRRAAKHE